MDFTTTRPGELSIIASDFDLRPMNFAQEGERLGYEPAVARAVCEQLGLQPKWVTLPLPDIYTALSSGEHDVIWFSQAITQERRAWADFTRPYGRFDEAILTLEESPLMDARDLQNRRLGVVAGSISLVLEEQLPEAHLVPFQPSPQIISDMLTALKQQRVDALLGDALNWMAMEADDPAFRVAFQLATQRPFGVGVLPGNRELLAALNAALNQLLVDGVLAKLWGQWIPYKPFPF